MITPTPLITLADAEADLASGVVLMAVGMLVVFVALVLILASIALIRRVADRPEGAPAVAPAPEAKTSAPAEAPAEDEAITPELLAVLTAAAVAATGTRVRVRRVALVGDRSDAWLAGGRASLMGSHKPPRAKR
jgi:Na+-transporting methylmalonyl-CoA/oxaloacetate decarboxylase gamma subunit